jgi:transcriptional regulator with XRE-family HTH domain
MTASIKLVSGEVDAPVAPGPTLGSKLRLRRRIKRLSLEQLATRTGLSTGLLSQVERDISAPSLRSLKLICDALDLPVGWLFEPNEKADSPYVVRTAQRRRIDLSQRGMIKELLSPDSVPGIQMMRLVIQPGGGSGDEEYALPAAECGTVTSGRLGLQIEGRRQVIEAGDSFAFQAGTPHLFWCEGEQPVDVLIVVSPAIY